MKHAKVTITVNVPKLINPVINIFTSKRGESHRKSEKVLRLKAKNDLKNTLRAGGSAGSYFLLFQSLRRLFDSLPSFTITFQK